jgi:hypothetical protein
MPGFLANVPLWGWIAIAIVAIVILWKWYKHKKATAYDPHIVRGADVSLVTPRDNPKNG